MSTTRVARVWHGSCMDDARGGDCYDRVGVGEYARDGAVQIAGENQDQR